ncbi:unnamed protein product [Linum trigynum]|uniref:Uncharacterized protein n=1 Tax=Linum trigynum TaxID=586398 RepID=A0AAV2DJ25_9ROSI
MREAARFDSQTNTGISVIPLLDSVLVNLNPKILEAQPAVLNQEKKSSLLLLLLNVGREETLWELRIQPFQLLLFP